MFNLYVIGIDYVQLIFTRMMLAAYFGLGPFSLEENDQRLMFLKKGGKGLGTFLWTKLTNESSLI